MLRFGKSAEKATKLAKKTSEPMAVVHCGSAYYAVKNAKFIGENINPKACRITVQPDGSIDHNEAYDKNAL